MWFTKLMGFYVISFAPNFVFLLNLKASCKLFFRDQEDIRTAKGDEEMALYNAKKRRIIYSSCRVGLIIIKDWNSCQHFSVLFFLCSQQFLYKSPALLLKSLPSVPSGWFRWWVSCWQASARPRAHAGIHGPVVWGGGGDCKLGGALRGSTFSTLLWPCLKCHFQAPGLLFMGDF